MLLRRGKRGAEELARGPTGSGSDEVTVAGGPRRSGTTVAAVQMARRPRELARLTVRAGGVLASGDRATLRSAVWATRAAVVAHRQLRRTPLAQVRLPSPTSYPPHARRGATAALRAFAASCLVRALVLQAWDAAHGTRRALVIGVTAPSSGFRAHAWLEGDRECHAGEFRELSRLPAR